MQFVNYDFYIYFSEPRNKYLSQDFEVASKWGLQDYAEGNKHRLKAGGEFLSLCRIRFNGLKPVTK
jgi:hypothetical protein